MRPSIDIFLIVDHSDSTKMIIDSLNEAIRTMIIALNDSFELMGVAKYLTLIQFNHRADILLETVPVEDIDPDSIRLTSSGATNTGAALLKALKIGTDRYETFKNNGDEIWHPIYFLFTDGYPDAGREATREEDEEVERVYRLAARKIKELENARQLVFVAGGFFDETLHGGRTVRANMDKLLELTTHRDRVIELPNGSAKTLKKFFSDLIPQTVVNTITNGRRAIDCAFLSEED